MTSQPKSKLIEIYRRMLRIRIFEETAIALSSKAELPGAIHTYIGQEATAVGACLGVGKPSSMTGHHRSHGHPIAKGAKLGPLMAELMGKSTGVCKGRGGSLHLADFSVGSLGESGIVGSSIPVAAGSGLSAKLLKEDRVTLCFFGDAASNTGAFHEALNLAGVWKLPVIFVCENNQYGVTTRTADVLAAESIASRASAYAMPGEIVDGQDPLAVYDAVHRAALRARAGDGPSLIEAETYRFREHAEGLPVSVVYRSKEEVEEWMQRDPIPLFRAQLASEYGVSEQELIDLEEEVRGEVDAAVEFGRTSPNPKPEAAFEGLFAPTPLVPELVAESKPTSDGSGRQMIYLAALAEAQREEMERDERVILMGEDVRANLWGGTGFAKDFPKERAMDTPLSEAGFVGAAIGASMTGLRPIVDMTFASFMYVAMDQFANQAAKLRYMFGNQTSLPVVYRALMMYGGSLGAHHSDRPYPTFMTMPGLKIAVPTTPYDAKGMLKAAIRDDNPVIFFEDATLWLTSGNVPEEDYLVPLGKAAIRREGSDLTLVGIAGGMRHVLDAAEELVEEGISVEVIDPRTLAPLDSETILNSVAKTGRLLIVDPAHTCCSAASEISAIVCEEAFDALRAPIRRITTPNVQIPFSPSMERPLYPNKEKILEAAKALLERN